MPLNWQNVAKTACFRHLFQRSVAKFKKSPFFCHKNLPVQKMALPLQPQIGALAHLVERNTGSVEVSGSSPLCSTNDKASG